MKKSTKVLVFFLVIMTWIGFVTTIYRHLEFSDHTRYEFSDISFRSPPTPSASVAKQNNDLADLVSRYKDKQVSVIELGTITPFTWDRVYLFAEVPWFMNYHDIDRILGKSWRDIESCDYAVMAAAANAYHALHSIFIFTNEGNTAYCFLYEHRLSSVYTNSADAETGIAHKDALFIIDKKGILRPIENDFLFLPLDLNTCIIPTPKAMMETSKPLAADSEPGIGVSRGRVKG